MKKIIKAPKYFIELFDEAMKYEKITAEMLNVSTNWISMKRNGKPEDFYEFYKMKSKNWTSDKKKKFELLLDIANSYSKVGWSRFRYENIENEDLKDLNLRYDQKIKKIIIQKDIKYYLVEFKKKLKKLFPDLKIDQNFKNQDD